MDGLLWTTFRRVFRHVIYKYFVQCDSTKISTVLSLTRVVPLKTYCTSFFCYTGQRSFVKQIVSCFTKLPCWSAICWIRTLLHQAHFKIEANCFALNSRMHCTPPSLKIVTASFLRGAQRQRILHVMTLHETCIKSCYYVLRASFLAWGFSLPSLSLSLVISLLAWPSEATYSGSSQERPHERS